MNLRPALLLAERIRGILAPHCERLEIAGSIRRGRAEVNDIDFVLQPRAGRDAAVRELLRRCTVVKDGPECMMVRSKEGVQVDVWFARGETRDMFNTTPSNWGSLLLCRTGSKEHNIHLAQRARAQEMKWETSRGLVVHPDTARAAVVAGATEEEIFQCLGLDFIPPAHRERTVDLSRRGEGREEEKRDWAAESFLPDPEPPSPAGQSCRSASEGGAAATALP